MICETLTIRKSLCNDHCFIICSPSFFSYFSYLNHSLTAQASDLPLFTRKRGWLSTNGKDKKMHQVLFTFLTLTLTVHKTKWVFISVRAAKQQKCFGCAS